MKFHCLTHPDVIFTFSSRFNALGNKSDDKFDNQFIGGILFKSFGSGDYFIYYESSGVITAGRCGAYLLKSFECVMYRGGFEGTYGNQVKFVNNVHNNMRST